MEPPARRATSFYGNFGVFFAHEEDHEISAEVGPEDAETVLVDPDDDNGAADSPGEETPLAARATTEATSVEAAATTEAADAKKMETAAQPSHRIPLEPPKSGTISASGVAEIVRWGGWITRIGHRDRTEAERALILCFRIDYTCIHNTFSHSIVFDIVDIRSSCKSGSESARALN